MKFRVLTLALLAGASTPTLVLAQSAQQPQKPAHDSRSQSGLTAAPTDFGRVDIYGNGAAEPAPDGVNRQDLGGGYMIEEEAVKTRSTVTRDAIAKMSPTANPYQMINLLPGVVITSTDNSGLNGGNIRIRGYNSDQLGLTIEGMPVNDSGNYALYPQEYVDSENIEQISIAQGSPDLDSPHIGASGGVINIYMRDPSKTRGGFVDFSYGMHSTAREFARAETGQIGDFRGYVSYSHYTENHWSGPGSNERQHVDFKGVWEPSQGNRIGLSVIFNDALNNFYQYPTLGSYNTLGARSVGYNTALPASYFVPSAGAWDRSANQANLYYKWRINPFRNLIVSAPSTFTISKDVTYDAIPYFWYGYGNGGGVTSVTENATASGSSFYYGRFNIGAADWNNNGVVTKNDKGMYYNPSITETLRPGLINKFTFDLGDHKLMLGYWFEYANHRQTAPYAFLNADGSVADPYIDSGAITIPGVGAPQYRDLLTQTVTNTGFVSDTWSLLDDKLTIESGVKVASIHRSVYNFLPGVTPLNTQSDLVALPQAGFRYKFWDYHQIFGSVGTSFRSTPNFALADSVNTSSGALTPANRLAPEKAVTVEIGHRYQSPLFATSVSLYGSHYENHQISTSVFLPNSSSSVSTTINAGAVDLWGVAAEIGTRPIYNFRPYLSANYLQTRILDNLSTSGTTPAGSPVSSINDFLPTKGKHLPNSPTWTGALGVDYDDGHILGNLAAKVTSRQYSTFMNDESISPYARIDAMVGYRFDDIAFGKKPELRVNLYNITNTHSLTGANSIKNNAVATRGVYGNMVSASAPTYYVGQGFSATATFSMGF
ncbi:TonB-dependent receptor (plasmid) [Methylosinus sp. C49]|uniref:TonB-dependent receptor n=1 Tax=Methylosinus sp. C49 TaxID=2699395 RepID=UPI001366E10A|nr:TonB-dependent receptor [Methylosinus sp. C49]BBU63840.1 TonB-dependent receptor [Methylosinus sp. C49]